MRTLRAAGKGIDIGWVAVVTLTPVEPTESPEILAVGQLSFGAFKRIVSAPVRHRSNRTSRPRSSPHGAYLIFEVPVRRQVANPDLEAICLLFEHNVDHASKPIASVDRRCTRWQPFAPVDHCQGNSAEIEKPRRSEGGLFSFPPAILQAHERNDGW